MRKIYTDLDTLFDTRLGVLNSISPEAAVTMCRSPDYWNRDHTNWAELTKGMVTNETFEERYRDRDNSILHTSIVTNIIPVLHSILNEYHNAKKDQAIDYEIAIEINIWPYELEVDELDELTQILQHEVLYPDLPIFYVSVPLDELTPQYIDTHYSAMVFFDFHRWIKTHLLAIAQHPCEGLNLIVPKLFDHDPKGLSVERKKEELLGFKIWFLPYFRLDFIDAEAFAMVRIDPNGPTTKKETPDATA